MAVFNIQSEMYYKLGEQSLSVNVKCFDLSSVPAVCVFERESAEKCTGSSGGLYLKN